MTEDIVWVQVPEVADDEKKEKGTGVSEEMKKLIKASIERNRELLEELAKY